MRRRRLTDDELVAMSSDELVKVLGSCNAVNRENAERILLARGPEAADALLPALVADAEGRRSRRRAFFGILAGYIAFIVALMWLTHGHFNGGGFFGAFGGLAGMLAASQMQKSGARMAARLDDVRFAGVLAEAMYLGDKSLAWDSRDGLLRLLPRMTAADERALTDKQRNALLRTLQGDSPELAGQVLELMGRSAELRALPAVERLASARPTAGQREELRTTALDCLERLNAAAEQVRAAERLLRPAPDAVEGAVLLRPAGAADEPQELLLRPAAEDAR